MKAAGSALYAGSVMHLRIRPRRHLLRYRTYSLLLDLDELPQLDTGLRYFSLNRFNLFSFYEKDHGEGAANGLREWVRRELRKADMAADGQIVLLTMPRILGYVFNPLSVYFCHDAAGGLRAILYEVNNTFGERHSYLIEVDEAQRHLTQLQQHCAKAMHVSPFIGPNMEYRFRVQPPAEHRPGLGLAVDVFDAEGRLLATHLRAERRALDDLQLLRLFLAYPLLTLKVTLGIHWEALRLWLKGLKVITKPAAAPPPLSVLKSGSRTT